MQYLVSEPLTNEAGYIPTSAEQILDSPKPEQQIHDTNNPAGVATLNLKHSLPEFQPMEPSRMFTI